jgi:hypothetical protein
MGNRLKVYVRAERDMFLDQEGGWDAWESAPASKKRILYTRWVGSAYRRFQQETDPGAVFEKLGYTLPVDGSGDDNLKIRALPGLEFPQTEPPRPPKRLNRKERYA